MKIRLTGITFLFCILFVSKGIGQLMIYKNYGEFESQTGQRYDTTYKYVGSSGSESFGGFTLVFKTRKNEKVTIKGGNVWGFSYHGMLFRISADKKAPVAVVSHGEIYYYENGFAYLSALANSSETASFPRGDQCYASKNLQSEIISLGPGPMGGTSTSELKKMKKQYPETADFVDCILSHHDGYVIMRHCAKKFNHEKEEEPQ